MTVGQLINVLEEFDSEMEVVLINTSVVEEAVNHINYPGSIIQDDLELDYDDSKTTVVTIQF